jgi:hypothetical protein
MSPRLARKSARSTFEILNIASLTLTLTRTQRGSKMWTDRAASLLGYNRQTMLTAAFGQPGSAFSRKMRWPSGMAGCGCGREPKCAVTLRLALKCNNICRTENSSGVSKLFRRSRQRGTHARTQHARTMPNGWMSRLDNEVFFIFFC